MEALMVSLGAAGVLLATRDGLTRLRAPSVRVRSKVGAGDSMVAGVVLALARGNSVKEAALYGLAAGSSAVTTPGSGLCTREGTEKLYHRMVSGAGSRAGRGA